MEADLAQLETDLSDAFIVKEDIVRVDTGRAPYPNGSDGSGRAHYINPKEDKTLDSIKRDTSLDRWTITNTYATSLSRELRSDVSKEYRHPRQRLGIGRLLHSQGVKNSISKQTVNYLNNIRKLPLLRDSKIFSFSAPPTSPDCMVVGIAYAHYYYNVYIHFVGGEPSWRRIPFDIDDYYHFSSLTLYGRDLYALRDEIGLYMFKEVGGDCAWEPAKSPTSCRTSFLRSSLLSCDQHLLHVIVGKFGESVEVFKLKKSKEWVKIDSLGKHMIFICGTSSFCIDAKKPHMENKIYFPRLPADNENMNDILFYSLETCRRILLCAPAQGYTVTTSTSSIPGLLTEYWNVHP
ncbi:Toll/interleukin-1 receptor domain-containing protein [Tanacetum coccineum]